MISRTFDRPVLRSVEEDSLVDVDVGAVSVRGSDEGSTMNIALETHKQETEWGTRCSEGSGRCAGRGSKIMTFDLRSLSKQHSVVSCRKLWHCASNIIRCLYTVYILVFYKLSPITANSDAAPMAHVPPMIELVLDDPEGRPSPVAAPVPAKSCMFL